MIRFKVVRASRILLFFAIVALAAVIGLIAARCAASGRAPEGRANASLVQAVADEAKTISVFASKAASGAPGRKPDAIEVEVLRATEAPEPPRSVLIYHTHTHEAYEQVTADPYEAVEAWRTADVGHSVVRVGEELARALRGLGFEVVHDETDHENAPLSTAYSRSLKTLEGYDRKFDLYIDLHRDAWVKGMPRACVCEDGAVCAQAMLLIGNGNGFDVKPDYKKNLAFARALTDKINAQQPGLCRDVMVKDGRYNQHIGTYAVLIEVGHNRNTLQEALNTVPYIAEGIAEAFSNLSQ